MQDAVVQIEIKWDLQRVWIDAAGDKWRWQFPLSRTVAIGTGYVIRWRDDARFVITNYHVIEAYYTDLPERPADTEEVGLWRVRNSTQVRIRTRQDAAGSKILYADPDADIAILSASGIAPEGEPLELADAESLAVGDMVAAYGYGSIDFDRLWSTEAIRYADRETGTVQEIGAFPDQCGNCTVLDATQKIMIRMRAIPGDSGGPLVNAAGRVVGLVYAAGQHGTLAIHVSQLADAVQQAWLDALADN